MNIYMYICRKNKSLHSHFYTRLYSRDQEIFIQGTVTRPSIGPARSESERVAGNVFRLVVVPRIAEQSDPGELRAAFDVKLSIEIDHRGERVFFFHRRFMRRRIRDSNIY